MKLKNGIEIVSLEAKTARVKMQSRFGASAISIDPEFRSRLAAEQVQVASQFTRQHNVKNENFNYEKAADILPRAEDAIFVDFRALSKTVVAGHWLDWTKDGVLEEGVGKLEGATVCPNHEFWDINNALGSVSKAWWDAEGKNSNGVPGINATYSIDALMNPKVARGLLWNPPYIHSTSLTVLFQFDFSHPQLVEERRFWNLLGEEVDGEIVRLIVTKILEIWEASLVFQGADRMAKKIGSGGGDPTQTEDDEDFESFSAAEDPPANSSKEKTMKLSQEQKTRLGIGFAGEEVPESEIFSAAESLAADKDKLATELAKHDPKRLESLEASAKVGETLIAEKRKEVTRLARLSELGADDEKLELDEVVSMQIEGADADQLIKLEAYYQKKVSDKFPKGGRSSLEDNEAVDRAAGAVEAEALPEVEAL
jgi:hypothetical protein